MKRKIFLFALLFGMCAYSQSEPAGSNPATPIGPGGPGPGGPIGPGPIDPGPIDPGPIDPGPIGPDPHNPVIPITYVAKIVFEYDTAGNQIKRELCINCLIKSGRQAAKKETAAEEPEISASQGGLTYYPNPVKEELTIQWAKEGEGHMQSISIYAMDGRQMGSMKNLKAASQTVPFQNYPQGTYIVVVQFDNKKEESIKIIKK